MSESPEVTPLCDRCGATAKVFLVNESSSFVTGQSYTLQFCGHHYNVYDIDLMNDGWIIERDERHE